MRDGLTKRKPTEKGTSYGNKTTDGNLVPDKHDVMSGKVSEI